MILIFIKMIIGIFIYAGLLYLYQTLIGEDVDMGSYWLGIASFLLVSCLNLLF